MNVPLIFDVRRGSTEDGPGIRTTVFFKGCTLNCRWCHNPESIDARQEIGFYPQACIGCGECQKVCPASACHLDTESRIDRTMCTRCGACADACPAKALRKIGRAYPPEELMDLLLRDMPLYRASGGGITLSGGEPMLHMEYAAEILRALKERRINTAIETNGLFPWGGFATMILPNIDLIMMDVKLADPEEHRQYTGASNAVILGNLRRLASEHSSLLQVRVPLVPGFTTSDENLGAIASLLSGLGIERSMLLPYNPTWFHKAAAIGRQVDPMLSPQMPSAEGSAAWHARFQSGITSSPSCALTRGAGHTKERKGKRYGRRKPDSEVRDVQAL